LLHSNCLSGDLDDTAVPLTRHEGRMIFVLKDSGGEPLDRVLSGDQGQPFELTRFLNIPIGLATALDQVHRHGLIHKDIFGECSLKLVISYVWRDLRKSGGLSW
jgi:serine/threonine protein kinase